MVLIFRERTLLWRLHPTRGYLRLSDPIDPAESDLRLRARLRRIEAPADERIVRFELLAEREPGSRFELFVELLGNQLNAVVTEGPDITIRHVLRRREGSRSLRVGHSYEPPAPTNRRGANGVVELGTWLEELGALAPEVRAGALVSGFAYTSRLNAATVLGAAATDASSEALERAHERWLTFVSGEEPAPILLQPDSGCQPYPAPLTGLTGRPLPSLLDCFEACASEAREAGAPAVVLEIDPALVARLEEVATLTGRRRTRLERELADLPDPVPLRAKGDLILARYREIEPGASRVALTDFDGTEVTVELDPKLPANRNADRYYDRAKRVVRAKERLPGLVEEAARDHTRLSDLLERTRRGEATPEEIRSALPPYVAVPRHGSPAASLPYKTYRSSGGLEIRVGRGARHNDDLTFHHSAPGDVWLHARHTSGAHVVLRWNGDGAPPARDLEEAATLAALNSKARTSGSVPVDWTLRKYVRKPRGAAPGSVVPDRVKTVFVEPDEALAERLATPE